MFRGDSPLNWNFNSRISWLNTTCPRTVYRFQQSIIKSAWIIYVKMLGTHEMHYFLTLIMLELVIIQIYNSVCLTYWVHKPSNSCIKFIRKNKKIHLNQFIFIYLLICVTILRCFYTFSLILFKYDWWYVLGGKVELVSLFLSAKFIVPRRLGLNMSRIN